MHINDPIERAKAHAASMYPDAAITTRSVKGRPVVLAREGNLIRLVKRVELTPATKRKSTPG